MEILLSATAFLIALTAIWFASNALGKMDSQFNEFIETNIKTLRNDVASNNKALVALTDRILAMEKDHTLQNNQKEMMVKIETLKKGLEELHQAIPQPGPKLRKPVPAKPAAAKPQDTSTP